MNTMFDDFIRIEQAVAQGAVADEWDALVREELVRPWGGRALGGHVPVLDFWTAKPTLGDALEQTGLYAFGCGVGANARLDYLGIAHGYPLGARFRGRYVGSPTEGTRRWTEIKFAAAHREALVRVPDHFSPRRRIDPATYTSRGIPLPTTRGLRRRIVRAERYAKNGLEQTWFYVMPAPPRTTKRELEVIEKTLIEATNAGLYRRSTSVRTPPLLNVVHARARSNPYLPIGELAGFNTWIDGSWWSAPAAG